MKCALNMVAEVWIGGIRSDVDLIFDMDLTGDTMYQIRSGGSRSRYVWTADMLSSIWILNEYFCVKIFNAICCFNDKQNSTSFMLYTNTLYYEVVVGS